MAKFIIKKKGEDEVTVDAPSIEIGSRSTCALWVDDPVIAERHVRITGHEGGGFSIEDLDTATGTYLNALAVKGVQEMPPAAELVIGVSRVVVAIDAATATLTLSYDEKKTFHYERRVDPLVWSRKEVEFGRWKLLRRANLAALASLLLLFPLSFLPPTTDIVMNPGALFHESIEPSRFHRDYHATLKMLEASDQDCSACHANFQGTPISKCVGCHEDTMKNNHPRIANAADWQVGCVYCHVEHRGAEVGILADQRKAESTCGLCHEDNRARSADSIVNVPMTATTYLYNTFSHADHAAKEGGRGLKCMDCHAFAEAPAKDVAGRWREFTPVDFQDCMSCHKEGAVHAKAAEKKRFHVDWHGAEQDSKYCLQCHAESHKPEMRTLPFEPADFLFGVTTRSHANDAHHFQGRSQGACAECHKNGSELQGGRWLEGRIFEHGTHVSKLKPEDAARLKVSNDECSACHAERMTSSSLEPIPNAHRHFTERACKECHDAVTGDADRRFNVVFSPSKDPARTAQTSRTDFPHAKHLNVEGGCFACHVFEEDPALRAAFRALPKTLPGAKDCMSCHTNHQDIGGGACADCHKPNDGVYWKDPAKWASVRRPIGTGFSHFSRGHKDLVNPEVPACDRCHDEKKVWAATTLADVPIPDENEPLCTNCHIGLKQRFHFMLSGK